MFVAFLITRCIGHAVNCQKQIQWTVKVLDYKSNALAMQIYYSCVCMYASICFHVHILWTIANIFHANIYSNVSYASNTCMYIARSVYMRAYFWKKPYINWLLDQWSHTKLSQKSWVVMKLSTWIYVQLRQKAWRICVILAKYPIKIPCAILNVILSKYLPHTLWIILDLLCSVISQWLLLSWQWMCNISIFWYYPDSKDHGANMGPTWVLLAPGGPHACPMNLAIGDLFWETYSLFTRWKQIV